MPYSLYNLEGNIVNSLKYRFIIPLNIFGLCILLITGLVIRLPYMKRSLWFDEIFTANQATFNTNFSSIINFLKDIDPHPPLHYLAMKFYAVLLNLHAWPVVSEGIEWKLRLPSLIMGLGSIILAYVFGLRFSIWSAWSAAIAVTFSPFTLGESVEARMYSSITFLTIISWILLFHGTKKSLLLAGIINALGIWQQVIYSIVIISQIIYLMSQKNLRRDWKNYIRLLLPPSTALLWLPVIVNLYLHGGVNSGVRTSSDSVSIALFDYLTGQNAFLNLTMFALIVIGLLGAAKKNEAIPVFAITLAIPFIWLIGSLIVNISSFRYAGFIVPGFAALVGLGISELTHKFTNFKNGQRTSLIAGLALLSLFVTAQLLVPRNRRVMTEPWREVAQIMAPHMKDGDLFAVSETGRQISLIYYLRTPAKYSSVIADATEINTLDAHRTWLIPESFGAPVEGAEKYRRWIKRTLASERAQKVFHSEKFDLYLVQPVPGHVRP